MMYQKATLFGDSAIAQKILATKSPRLVKTLGRKVNNFDASLWDERKYRVVCDGNYLKFTKKLADSDEESSTASGFDLKQALLDTADSELVEASPFDRVWGIGFAKENAGHNRKEWGENLLGKALMEVRDRIRREDADCSDAPNEILPEADEVPKS
jgi:ribA/ribD-fused uncharacterized protein